MKALRVTLFLIAMTVLVAQTFRDVYVRWMEPRGSVLDRFSTKTEQDISSARSLDQLVALYAAAHQRVLDYEKTNPPKSDQEDYQRKQQEPYASENKVREAINDWEEKSKEIFELHRFWAAGLFALVLAVLVARRDRWIAMSLLIVAFSEMVYATCPSFRGPQPEFDHLLVQKVIFSLLSLLCLLWAWRWTNRSPHFDSRDATSRV
jgi:hypothetical protein